MLVAGVQRGIDSKVDPYSATHESLAVEGLPYLDRGFGIEEGRHYAAEGFEGCPGVDRCMLVYEFADLDEI